MQDCMAQYPTVYNQNLRDDDKEEGGVGMIGIPGVGGDDEEEEDDGASEKPEIPTGGKEIAVKN